MPRLKPDMVVQRWNDRAARFVARTTKVKPYLNGISLLGVHIKRNIRQLMQWFGTRSNHKCMLMIRKVKYTTPVKYFALAVLVFLSQGCLTYYQYAGVKYYNRAEALDVVRTDITGKVNGVKKQPNYFGGSVLVYIPTYEIFRKYGVKVGKNATKEGVDYIAKVVEIDMLSIPDVIERGGMFNSVIRSRNLPDIKSTKPDFIVQLNTLGVDKWQWFVSIIDDVGNKVPVNFDGTKVGTERLNSYNESLVRALKGLNVTEVEK